MFIEKIIWTITLFITAICVKKGFKNDTVYWTIKNFWILAILSLVDSIMNISYSAFGKIDSYYYKHAEIFQTTYILFEFYVFACFYIDVLWNKKVEVKRAIIYSIIAIATVILISVYAGAELKFNIVAVEFVIINLSAAITFIKQIKNDDIKISKSENLINIGLLIFINMTTPYYLATYNMKIDLSDTFYISNIINSSGYFILYYNLKKSL
jgi:hypothetical protein